VQLIQPVHPGRRSINLAPAKAKSRRAEAHALNVLSYHTEEGQKYVEEIFCDALSEFSR